jgi:hypothetical protein
MAHLFHCMHPKVAQFRKDQQTKLWATLTRIGTPVAILTAFQDGFHVQHLNTSVSNPPLSSRMTDLSQQSVNTAQNVVNQAFHNQVVIGWMNFLRGHISYQWHNAYCELHARGNRSVDGSLWASKVVAAVLNYSLSIWKFRCDLLHGTTVEEARGYGWTNLEERLQKRTRSLQAMPLFCPTGYARCSPFPCITFQPSLATNCSSKN